MKTKDRGNGGVGESPFRVAVGKRLSSKHRGRSREKLFAALKDADAVIVRTYTQVNEAFLAADQKLASSGRRAWA